MNDNITAFDFLSIGSMSDENPEFTRIGAPYFTILERMAGTPISEIKKSKNTAIVFFILTGGTEKKTLSHINDELFDKNSPILLLAHPGNNSLPASLEILAKLQQDGHRGQIIYLSSPEDTAGLEQLSLFINLMETNQLLQDARIGLVGKPSDWLVASMPDYKTLTTAWGPKVLDIDFDSYFNKVEQVDSSKNLEPISNFITQANHIDGPKQEDFKKSVDVYTALQEVVKENHLNALSVRCFDLVTRHQSTGCYALSQLNDDQVVAGCEGDLVSTVGMLWAKYLLKASAWMANPARIDKKNNTLVLAHCTIATGMTTQYELLTHFETDLGIGIRGLVSPQPCTIFRLGGKKMEKLWITEGLITQSGSAENLCRTQLEIKLSHTDVQDQLLENPLGNHVILVFGAHEKIMTQYHQLFIKNHH